MVSPTIFPIPTTELVDERRRITPPWYRFFVSLIQRTGGTAGRLTPLPADPFQVSLLSLGDGGEEAPAAIFPISLEGENAEVVDGSTSLVFGGSGETATLDDLLWLGFQRQAEASVQLLDALSAQPADVVMQIPLTSDPVPPAPEGITLGASPYAFTPGFDGFAVVSGGTVTAITVSRDGGTTVFATGQIAGSFPMSLLDTLTITYTVLPTLTFFRRG